MNREFLLEAVLAIVIGLLVVVLSVYRTSKEPKAGPMRRGGMVALLVYVVIAAPVIVRDGMTAWGLLALLILAAVPVAGMQLAGSRPAAQGTAPEYARRLVSIGLAAAMLIAAGQTLSMLSLVDPRVLVVVLAVVTALLVAQDGLAASGRIGSLAMWLMVIPVLIALALGFLLGRPGQAVGAIIKVDGPSLWTLLALAVGLFVLGGADAGLAASRAQDGWSPGRVLAGVFALVILIGAGLLMFFGGAILAPSMQFFVVPANLNLLPGLAGLVLAVLTVLFAALVASPIGGLRTGDASAHWVSIGAAVAVVLALLDPGLEWIVVAASLLAASLAARTARGTMVGLIVAVVAGVVLTLTGNMAFGWQFLVAVVVVLGVSALVPAEDRTPEPAGNS
ncbi:MAG TPA: hypothetical protein PLT68_05070 [Actinomycetota bacterium]|nr:hypothetical protein [Actinomycetota bacterium]